MPYVSIRNLQVNAAGVIDNLHASGQPAVITRKGEPVAVLCAVDRDELEDFFLAKTPELAEVMAATEKAVASGDPGLTAEEVRAALG